MTGYFVVGEQVLKVVGARNAKSPIVQLGFCYSSTHSQRSGCPKSSKITFFLGRGL